MSDYSWKRGKSKGVYISLGQLACPTQSSRAGSGVGLALAATLWD